MPRTFTFLGTGTSVGVPMLGCGCATCLSPNPRNQRWRCAALIENSRGYLLIDAPPELRLQLLRARAPLVHALLLTHFHADHLFGLDDVRVFPHRLGGSLPIYCNAETEAVIRRNFAYAFEADTALTYSFVPQLHFESISPGRPFQALGETILPIALDHAQFNVLGFRIGNLAYCTDVSSVPPASIEMLQGLDVLVLDALRHKPHPAHLSLSEALKVVERLRPRQTWLTHMSHDLEHEETERALPGNVRLAYDTLSFEF
jgi:phosphoribosyl 1,2-cyclic phosphate phosphodiesterase